MARNKTGSKRRRTAGIAEEEPLLREEPDECATREVADQAEPPRAHPPPAAQQAPRETLPASPATPAAATTGTTNVRRFKLGDKVLHTLMRVNGIVAQLPTAGDFLHAGKVCVRYLVVDKKVQVMRTMWCWPAELDLVWVSPRRTGTCVAPEVDERQAPQTQHEVPQQHPPRPTAHVRPFQREMLDLEQTMADAAEGMPELAAHERARTMPQKTTSKQIYKSSGPCGDRQTKETLVRIEDRIAAFPDNSFKVASSATGKVLFCQCCPKTVQNILVTIKTHVASTKHQERLKTWLKRNSTDNDVIEFLHDYFVQHPKEKDSTIGKELKLYRWRVVEACMAAGIPLEKIDSLRDLLERAGLGLTSSSHLRAFIPKIEEMEYRRLMTELDGQPVCIIFDGTTRRGDCNAVLMRWCSATFQIQQRLVALRTAKHHMNGETLAPFLMDVIGKLGVRTASVVCISRDSCATNGKAERSIKPILTQAESMLCISHTLSHCGEHCDLPVLKEFMTPWLSLVQHHASAKSAWHEMVGSSMKGFSTTRWFSREECCNEISENFSCLPKFIDYLVDNEIGDALPRRMQDILRKDASQLQLELACTLDMKPLLTTCISLEGDGLAILLAYQKLQSLLNWGDKLGQNSDSMPNVAALLRSRIQIEPGVKVYEYFADTDPPGWFTGVVVEPRVEGLITVKYSDNSKIDQELHEVQKWLDIRELEDWKRVTAAAKCGIAYLRNRMTGSLPAQQRNYDCSHMFNVLRAVQAFNPSWAAHNLTPELVDLLSLVRPLGAKVAELKAELPQYLTVAATVTIDHTENAQDHSFTQQVLKFYTEHGSEFPAWAAAARIVCSFTPNSAAAERVFSLLNCMFGDQQFAALADYIQTAVMLKYNKRLVG